MKISVRTEANFVMKFLLTPTSFSITNTRFSPRSVDRRPENTPAKTRSHANCKVKFIPTEARHKTKNTRWEEPTSPKVSCMGQINHKKKEESCKLIKRPSPPQQVTKPPSFGVQKMLRYVVRLRRPSKMETETVSLPVPVAAVPSLGQLKRFTCSRESTLAGFDWKANLAAVNPIGRGDCYENKGCGDDAKIMVPLCAPKLLGGVAALEPKKEVNLWKRRTINPPISLRLN